jgi:hypothetical protein
MSNDFLLGVIWIIYILSSSSSKINDLLHIQHKYIHKTPNSRQGHSRKQEESKILQLN